MADLDEVLTAIRDTATAALDAEGLVQQVPDGRGGMRGGIRVYVGWPGGELDADLAQGIAHVSVFQRAGIGRSLGASLDGWTQGPPNDPGVTAASAGDAATLSGAVARDDVLAAALDGERAWTVAPTKGQSAAQVAAALAAAVSVDRPAIATGPVLTLPGAFRAVVRVAAGGFERRELGRYEQGIMVTAWAPSPALRTRIVSVLHPVFVEEHRSLPMPDGTTASLAYAGTVSDDAARRQPLFRRDLLLTAEYALVALRRAPPIVATRLDIDTDPVTVRRTAIQ